MSIDETTRNWQEIFDIPRRLRLQRFNRVYGPIGSVTDWIGLMGNRFQARGAGFVLVAGQDQACGFDGDCRRDPHNSTGRDGQLH